MKCPLCDKDLEDINNILPHVFSKHKQEIVDKMTEISYREDELGERRDRETA